MLIGYMRVSKADGSQSTDLHRDALIATGKLAGACGYGWVFRGAQPFTLRSHAADNIQNIGKLLLIYG